MAQREREIPAILELRLKLTQTRILFFFNLLFVVLLIVREIFLFTICLSVTGILYFSLYIFIGFYWNIDLTAYSVATWVGIQANLWGIFVAIIVAWFASPANGIEELILTSFILCCDLLFSPQYSLHYKNTICFNNQIHKVQGVITRLWYFFSLCRYVLLLIFFF
jgi:hypothetical protein